MVVEQKGRDVWRGRFKSINEAIENDVAAVGVDRILLTRAQQYDVTTVMVVIEEQRRIFLAPITQLLDADEARSRTNYQGRAHRIMDYAKWTQKYLGPTLHTKRNRASA